MKKIIDNFILIGTSHVAENSTKELEEIIKKYNPEVIGIELDIKRFKSLMNDNSNNTKKQNTYKQIKELGGFGYLFSLIAGFVQKKVGNKINVSPGVDMKQGYKTARDNKIPVSLIDLDLKITLKKLSKLSFFKKIKLILSIFFKSFKKEYRKLLNFDLKKVPDEKLITQMINILRKETYDLYKILIEDRNHYMTKKLFELQKKHNGYIVAIVGAGHIEGMSELIKEKIKNDNQNNISFSFNTNIENQNNIY